MAANCRPLKLFYCPPKPGDVWPPLQSTQSAATATRREGGVAGPPRREKRDKPKGCKKLFAGNLSYNIDDDAVMDFFKDCGTLVGLRWLTHKDSGEFKVSTIVGRMGQGTAITPLTWTDGSGLWICGVRHHRRGGQSYKARWQGAAWQVPYLLHFLSL